MIALHASVTARGEPGTVIGRHGLAHNGLMYVVRHADGRVRVYAAAAVRVAIAPVAMRTGLRLAAVDGERVG